jgi:hypothetical protein
MPIKEPRHRPFKRAGLLLLTLTALACGGLGLLLFQTYQATEYPGAARVSDQNLTVYTPNFAIRRTTVYRTDDPFPSVYNWYSNRFELGPETYAQGTCILMSKAANRAWLVEEQMSVMVCNTPTGRMMFVMRAFLVRFSR